MPSDSKISFARIAALSSIAGYVLALSGCASLRAPAQIQHEIAVSQEVQAAADAHARSARLFADAQIAIPVLINADCSRHEAHEPFSIATDAYMDGHQTAEMFTALHRAAGVDSKFRVFAIAADDTSGLIVGDEVVALNGEKLEDPRIGASTMKLMSHRKDFASEPFVRVRLATGRELTVPTKEGCAGPVYSNGLVNSLDLKFEDLVVNVRVTLPGWVVQAIEDKDEAAYVVLWSQYFLASEASNSEFRVEMAKLGVTTVPALALKFLVPLVGDRLGGALVKSVANASVDNLVPGADAWAQAEMKKYGFDPAAALRLNARLIERKQAVGRFQMDDARLAAARARVATQQAAIPANLAPSPHQ